MWRSLVAHLHGVQGVEGSNPFTPTIKIKDLASKGAKSFFFMLGKTVICPHICPHRLICLRCWVSGAAATCTVPPMFVSRIGLPVSNHAELPAQRCWGVGVLRAGLFNSAGDALEDAGEEDHSTTSPARVAVTYKLFFRLAMSLLIRSSRVTLND